MKYKLLLCLSTYKRPHLAAFQITRLLALDPGYDLSVSIKGISEYEFRRTFQTEWKEHIESGRLKLAFHSNRGQTHNILDPMRAHVDEYDLFAKIDDDDYYLDRYFTELANFYKDLPVLPGISNAPHITAFLVGMHGNPFLKNYNIPGASGPTLVISREFLKELLSLEKNNYFNNQNTPEDALWVKMARERHTLVHRPGSSTECNPLIYNTNTISCTRGSIIPSDMKKHYEKNPSSQLEETTLHVITPSESYTFRTFGDTATRCDNGMEYTINRYDKNTFETTDKEGKKEYFYRHETGAFLSRDIPCETVSLW